MALWLLLTPGTWHLTPALGQQAQAQSGQPVYAVNAKYVQGVGPGYWPTAGSGLTLNIAAGTAYCSDPPVLVTYAGGTLTMTASQTNYVYLDPAASCAPAKNTTGFVVGQVPLAKVVTNGSAITSITDARNWFLPVTWAMDSTGSYLKPAAPVLQTTNHALGDYGVSDWELDSNYIYSTNRLKDASKSSWGLFLGAGTGVSDYVNDSFGIFSAPATAGAPSYGRRLTIDAEGKTVIGDAVQPIAQMDLRPVSTSTVGLNIKLKSSPSANAFQIQDSAGATKLKVTGGFNLVPTALADIRIPIDAVGDGVADDTTAIQNAINVSGGHTVFFPPGTYKVTSTLTVPAFVGLLGSGVDVTTFNFTGTARFIASVQPSGACNSQVFRDFTATLSGNPNTGITFIDLTGGAGNCVFQNIKLVTNATAGQNGIRIYGRNPNFPDSPGTPNRGQYYNQFINVRMQVDPPPVTILTVVRTSGVVTVTMVGAGPHGFKSGESVGIANVTDTSFDGAFTINPNPTDTTFAYNQAGSDTSSSDGTASVQSIGVGLHLLGNVNAGETINANEVIGGKYDGFTTGIKIENGNGNTIINPVINGPASTAAIVVEGTGTVFGNMIICPYLDNAIIGYRLLLKHTGGSASFMATIVDSLNLRTPADIAIEEDVTGAARYTLYGRGVFIRGQGTVNDDESGMVRNVRNDTRFTVRGGSAAASGALLMSGTSYSGGGNAVSNNGGFSASIQDNASAQFRVVKYDGSTHTQLVNVDNSGNGGFLADLSFKGLIGTTNKFTVTGTATGARTWTFQDSSDTVVGRATTDTLTNKTLGGGGASTPNTIFNRFRASQGSGLGLSDVGSLTGWGSGASVTGIGGTDSATLIAIASGTGPSANPTFVLTYKNGAWVAAPVATCTVDGGSATLAACAVATTTTTATVTFIGTPNASSTYKFNLISIGK